MRKDKGLNGDLDRLPMLTWIMFLKFLDDMERHAEAEGDARRARSSGRPSRPPTAGATGRRKTTASPATNSSPSSTRTKAMRPDGKRGPGLFAYLRTLQSANGGDRRDVIATVFHGTVNRMVNGYLLRDVINKVNGIHFDSSDEIHTLGHLYESMLREMRDAAGDSGEFYTPRPVVKFMVAVIEPAARGNGSRPGLRHRRLPCGGLSTIWKSSARRSRTAGHSSRRASSAARPSRFRTCSAR